MRSFFLRKLDGLMNLPILGQLVIVLILTGGLMWGISSLSDDSFYKVFMHSTNPPENVEDKHKAIIIIAEFLFFSIFFLGLFVTLFVNWIDRRRERYINGDARYDIRNDFNLILGGHEMVGSLCKKLLSLRKLTIVIMSQRNAEILRKEIFSKIDPDLRKYIVVYNGTRVSESDLEEVYPANAESIYIIGENERIDGSDHDELNMTCFDMVKDMIKKQYPDGQKIIPVHVMFCYHSTFVSFQFTDLDTPKSVRFIPFSFYETWAQQVLVPPTSDNYNPLEGDKRLSGKSDYRVHLIIVGMSKMGVAMAVEAAQVAHYPNFQSTGRRTLITVIDKDMAVEMNYFKSRYPVMFSLARQRYVSGDEITYTHDFTPDKNDWIDPVKKGTPYSEELIGDRTVDIDWEFIGGNIASPEIRDYLEAAAADKRSITTIAVCLPDTVEAITASMYMPDSVYKNVNQILVYQQSSDSIVDALKNGGVRNESQVITASRGRNKVRAFGMMDLCDYLSPVYNLEAKLVHYFFDKYPFGENEEAQELFIKEFFNQEFTGTFYEELERMWHKIGGDKGKSAMSLKWSNIFNALTIPIKLRSAGLMYHITEIPKDKLREIAIAEHQRWNMEQILMGFRPELPSDKEQFPINMDKRLKHLRDNMIHPSITSFDKLSDSEKEKDDILIICIPAIIRIKEKADQYFNPQ